MARVYLDHNATTPLRPEARAAMLDALDVTGNPSSVHAEGRAAKSLLERSRATLAGALGADGADIVFTSGATEAAALACAGRDLRSAGVEHDAVRAWTSEVLPVDAAGRVRVEAPEQSTLQLANSETGVVQSVPEGLAVCDMTQGFGKLPVAFNWLGCDMAIVSAHKIGGPRGVGALVLRKGLDVTARLRGGGQEMGRRAGTENLAGIAGFAAAAEAAARDLAAGVWADVAARRDALEARLVEVAPDIIFMGQDAPRLPNTSNFLCPGWRGETQVMQMDLAGFAVSAGSACSSGKTRASATLAAMGVAPDLAACGLRVSLGPETTETEIMRFADTWAKHYERHRARPA